jgi:magnesium chelatase family protein
LKQRFAPGHREAARGIQIERYQSLKLFSNSQLSAKLIKQYCSVDAHSLALMEKSVRKFHLSARAYHRVLKVARTIADLDGAPDIGTQHLAEACSTGRWISTSVSSKSL